MPNEHLKIDNQLCFAIYAFFRMLTRMYRPLLNQLDLTYPHPIGVVGGKPADSYRTG